MAKKQLSAWTKGDTDSLMDLRRAFHTLKGGGRMVGATAIGELSWSLENLLNRVIDKSVPERDEIFQIADNALNSYASLIDKLKSGNLSEEPADVVELKEKALDLADPTKQIGEEVIENSELTQTFIAEASELREDIVRLAADLSNSDDIVEKRGQLMHAMHTLTDCARNAEFDDISDTLKPLLQLSRHYHSVEEDFSNEFITLLSLWSGKFSECLTSIDTTGKYDLEPLQTLGEQCTELLRKEEKDLAQHSNNRTKRFRPLHRLMAEELENLIIAEQIIQDWQIDQAKPDQLEALLQDLGLLQETADLCQVEEVSELCSYIIAFQSVSDNSVPISAEKSECLLKAYDHLLIMLDAMASWLVIPKVPRELIDALDKLSGNVSLDALANIDSESESTALEQPPATLAEESAAVSEQQTGLEDKQADSEDDKAAVEAKQEPADETEQEATAEENLETPTSKEPEAPIIDEPLDDSIDGLNPESDAEDEFERELMDTFLEEGEELVHDIDRSLKEWRKDPQDFNHADSIHRALHTLKGGARLSGLPILGDISHDFESFIIDQQLSRNADEGFFHNALERLDSVTSHLESVRASSLTGGAIVEPAPVVPEPAPAETTPAEEKPASKTKAKKGRKKTTAKSTTKTAAKKETKATKAKKAPAKAASKTEDTLKAATLEEAAADAVRRELRQETIRLRSDQVDEMVNLAGESTVYRGRIEAQLTDIDTQLDELEATINRIQQLTRRLDTETEAQINFRTEQIAESEEDLEFDPLEMDRYSTLQQLSRQLIESASDLQDLRDTLSEGTRDTNTLVVQSSRILSKLNDQLLSTRMVPFTQLVPRLERITRQVSRELSKSIELTALNVEGELDRQILEQILPPLEHILRNSADHGIEDAATREAAGKDTVGRIYLNVRREGSYTVMRIADDGGGVNLEAVRNRAVANGLVDEAESYALSKDSLLELLFTPGFSTAEEVTQISGRGVGMDVVRSTLRDMGGNINIETEEGKGTAFELSVPFTLSVNRALMVRSGEDTYAIPLSSLEALVRIEKQELETFYSGEREKLSYDSEDYDFGYLGELLQTLERPPLDTLLEPTIPMTLFRSGQKRIALMVDEIISSQEMVVKSLSAPFKLLPGISGAAIMGDGGIVVALDMPTLVGSHYKQLEAGGTDKVEIKGAHSTEETPRVMVVDDSVTVRKVTSRFLNRQGYIVESARDGVEALRLIHDQKPDLMLVDVEMPRMDGFELLGILRSTDKFKDLPVFLITSRTGAKHKERGLSLGAQRYFGKPYREDELLDAMNEYLIPDGNA